MGNEDFEYPRDIRWKCLKCGACCGDLPGRVRRILLLPSDLERIEESWDKPEEFCEKVLGEEPFRFEMNKKSGKCVFLSEDGCTIYEIRPLICRFFPFWLERGKDGFRFLVTGECQGIGKGEEVALEHFKMLFAMARKELG